MIVKNGIPMQTNDNAFRHLAFFLFVTWLLVAAAATAAEQKNQETVQVKSQYRTRSNGSWTDESRWTFVKTGPNERSVWLDRQPSSRFVLTYTENGRLDQVSQVQQDQEGKEQSKPLSLTTAGPYRLSDGFPLPFDDLNPSDENDDQVTLKKRAGGASFAFPLRRSVVSVSVEKATGQGMLPKGWKQETPPERLLLITMWKNDALMVRQLWLPGADWWLYEETPFRRSWRME